MIRDVPNYCICLVYGYVKLTCYIFMLLIIVCLRLSYCYAVTETLHFRKSISVSFFPYLFYRCAVSACFYLNRQLKLSPTSSNFYAANFPHKNINIYFHTSYIFTKMTIYNLHTNPIQIFHLI